MIKKLKQMVKNLLLKRGYKTKRHLVVIESDDWGSIRSSKQGVAFIKENYPNFKLDAYQSVDCLESEKDLLSLFKVLNKYKDSFGNHPIITANFIMQNAIYDGQNIEYENFTNTYTRYAYSSLKVIKENFTNKSFIPQLHGLVHFNLQKQKDTARKNKMVNECWKQEMIGLCEGEYVGMDTFNIKPGDETYCTNIKKSADIFYKTFGYKAESFVFPCYVFNSEYEKFLLESGIKNIQTSLIQNIPIKKVTAKEYNKKFRYMGEKNSIGGIYTVRNCFFEPIKFQSQSKTVVDCLNNCLNQVENAFRNKKPAIICSHRANYVGGINKTQQEENLKYLDLLLQSILERWSDVQFVSSTELCKIIQEDKCK